MSRAHEVVSSVLVVVAFFCGVALSGRDIRKRHTDEQKEYWTWRHTHH